MAPRPEPNACSLAELAERTGATVEGDGGVMVARMATLEHGGPGDIAFLANPRYRAQLATTRASAVIVAPDAVAATSLPKLVSKNPYALYARVASLLHPPAAVAPGVHPSAFVDASARIAPSASVGAFAVVGAHAVIGERSVLGAHVVV